jgi:hypothetical protein
MLNIKNKKGRNKKPFHIFKDTVTSFGGLGAVWNSMLLRSLGWSPMILLPTCWDCRKAPACPAPTCSLHKAFPSYASRISLFLLFHKICVPFLSLAPHLILEDIIVKIFLYDIYFMKVLEIVWNLGKY